MCASSRSAVNSARLVELRFGVAGLMGPKSREVRGPQARGEPDVLLLADLRASDGAVSTKAV